MPTINIHAHCADNESVLALLEQVQLNTSWHHIDVTADIEHLGDDNDDCAAGYMAAAQRISSTEQELGRLVQEHGPSDLCTDPFCDVDHDDPVEQHILSASEDIGTISEAIMFAFVHLINDHGYNAWSCKDQANAFLHNALHEPGFDTLNWDELPHGARSLWLIVLWAVQDWAARGVTLTLGQSMLRGIEADARGAVKL